MAPSPTGLLHVGTARAALFNFLFARHYGGTFILRFEDTDPERSKKDFEQNILEGLEWLGMDWDEGPLVGQEGYKGDYGPYNQSGRGHIYKKYLQKLLDEGKAFYCSHSKEFLEAEREEQTKRKEHPRHTCSERDAGGTSGIIRLKNDAKGNVSFEDIIRGTISFAAEDLGDLAIARGMDSALYHFAVVVDDIEMLITHVIRGEDHIPNTPKHLLIQQALGAEPPIYAHLPLVLGMDRSKLSKRGGSTSVDEYRKQGYLPEAIINFIALLGWHPAGDKEIFTPQELIQEFSLERIQKSGAAFDIEKLKWLNGEHIKALPPDILAEKLKPYLEDGREAPKEYLTKIAALEQPRLRILSEIKDKVGYFFHEPSYEVSLLLWKGKQDPRAAAENLKKVHDILCDIEQNTFTEEHLREILMPVAEERGRGEVLWPLRAALSGREASPDPFEIMSALGKEKTLGRIMHGLDVLGAALE